MEDRAVFKGISQITWVSLSVADVEGRLKAACRGGIPHWFRPLGRPAKEGSHPLYLKAPSLYRRGAPCLGPPGSVTAAKAQTLQLWIWLMVQLQGMHLSHPNGVAAEYTLHAISPRRPCHHARGSCWP